MPESSQVLTALFSTSLATACVAPSFAPDPLIAEQALQVSSEAKLMFAKLKATGEPDCDYPHNQASYDHLNQLAEALRDDLAANKASDALLRAGDALSRSIADARASHQLASADASDSNGLCLASVAIELNAEAIMRASQAIAATQTPN